MGSVPIIMLLLTITLFSSFITLCPADIAQVKYLGGITFLLKDRCPESATQADQDLYKQCADNEILHTQCVTDRLLTGDKLTVPVFTNIYDCPYNGRRLDGKGSAGSQNVDQALADRFL